MTGEVTFPEMRNEVIAALRSLSDPVHQATRWGRSIEGVDYYDDLTLNVNTLYDDCQVLPSPESAVPAVLLERDIPSLSELQAALGPMIVDLGNRSDADYLADPRWPTVVAAAKSALDAMHQPAP